jgi:hypothetical protein
MVYMSLEETLELARTALSVAEKKAEDLTSNPTYWKSQVERERRLVESLEAEIRAGSEDQPIRKGSRRRGQSAAANGLPTT